jgi:hypothetical protein
MLWWMGVAAGLAQTFDEIGRSGLTSNATESLALVSEDLRISSYSVRVNDRFRYLGTAPREVRFALWGVPQSAGAGCGIMWSRVGNWMDPTVSLGGVSTPANFSQRALLRTAEGVLRDVTELIEDAGLSVDVCENRHEDAVSRLPQEVLRMLNAQDLVGPGPAFEPLWDVQPLYTWSVRVTAGAMFNLTYSYYRIAGPQYRVDGTLPACQWSSWPNAALTSKYCVDSSGAQGLAARAVGGMIEWGELFFPLRGASQWAGPVERLRIEVDKADPAVLLSLCARGVKKVSDTAFVWERFDLEPAADLHAMVAERPADLSGWPLCGTRYPTHTE